MTEEEVKKLIADAIAKERDRLANAVYYVNMPYTYGYDEPKPDFDSFVTRISDAIRNGGTE